MSKPLILITNDDGITAPGIRFLINIMAEIGDVYVVAPSRPQSGMGHAITLDSIISIEKIIIKGSKAIEEWSCSGTPADCVKLAINEILPKMPDLCVSGINHGSNAAVNILYSGTMSAATEAGIEGVASIGFSLCDMSWNADFSNTRDYIKKITLNTLSNGIPDGTILNVNFPKTNYIKGVKICRQTKSNWIEEFEERTNPKGKRYYWMTGKFVNLDKGEDTDQWALDNDYASIVPVKVDRTNHEFLKTINTWNL